MKTPRVHGSQYTPRKTEATHVYISEAGRKWDTQLPLFSRAPQRYVSVGSCPFPRKLPLNITCCYEPSDVPGALHANLA